jgi:hypothetical protein
VGHSSQRTSFAFLQAELVVLHLHYTLGLQLHPLHFLDELPLPLVLYPGLIGGDLQGLFEWVPISGREVEMKLSEVANIVVFAAGIAVVELEVETLPFAEKQALGAFVVVVVDADGTELVESGIAFLLLRELTLHVADKASFDIVKLIGELNHPFFAVILLLLGQHQLSPELLVLHLQSKDVTLL